MLHSGKQAQKRKMLLHVDQLKKNTPSLLKVCTVKNSAGSKSYRCVLCSGNILYSVYGVETGGVLRGSKKLLYNTVIVYDVDRWRDWGTLRW